MKSISKCAFTLNAIYKIKIDHTKESCRPIHRLCIYSAPICQKYDEQYDVWDDRTSICAHR